MLLKKDKTPLMCRPLARIIEIMQGGEGKARVGKARTANSTYVRPVTKICVLPSQEFISTDVFPNDK